jgi:hypothetical protein
MVIVNSGKKKAQPRALKNCSKAFLGKVLGIEWNCCGEENLDVQFHF